MARNRKYQSAANRFGPALKAFLLCLLIGGSGVGYVWQKDQISQLGQQIKKRELRLADLENQSEKLKRAIGDDALAAFPGKAHSGIGSGPGAASADASVAAGRAGARSARAGARTAIRGTGRGGDGAEGLNENFAAARDAVG